MRRIYFVAEGSHDVEALGRFLSSLGARRVQSIDKLDPYWSRLVPRIFPYEGDLLRRVPVPVFFQADKLSVAVHSASGISRISKITKASLANLDELPVAVGVVVDADDRSASDVWNEVLAGMSEYDFGQAPGQAGVSEPRAGVFVLPNNEGHGTLEAILLKCGEKVYPELIGSACDWIAKLDPENNSIFVTADKSKFFAKRAGKIKAVFASLASVLRPARSVQVSIQDNRWLSNTEALSIPEVAALQALVSKLMDD